MICRIGKTGIILFAILLLVTPVNADLGITLRTIPEYRSTDRTSPFFLPEPFAREKTESSRQELELQFNRGGINTLSTLRNEIQNGGAIHYKAVLNELYLDHSFYGQDFSIGKKILSWGVGFAFRPLDIIQQENRRRFSPQALEGVPMLVWQYFGSDTALTVVAANPRRTQNTDQKNEASLAFKGYQLKGDTDLHGVLRLSERQRWQSGAGFAHVLNDRQEIHFSLLYQYRYERPLNPLLKQDENDVPLAASDPIVQQARYNSIKALVGSGWSGENGWSVLTELWYDNEAYRAEDWRNLMKLTQRQLSFLGSAGIPKQAVFENITANYRYFSRPNLLPWNTFIRISYEAGDLKTAFDLLYTPEDQGRVLSLQSNYTIKAHTFALGVRHFGGPANAAYRLLPTQWQGFLSWQWHLR